MDKIIFWTAVIITLLCILMLVSVTYTEIHQEEKKFRWYFYIPSSVINALFGTTAPYLLFYAIFGAGGLMSILIPLVCLGIIIGVNAGLMIFFSRNETFSIKLYFSYALVSLIVVSFWIITLMNFLNTIA